MTAPKSALENRRDRSTHEKKKAWLSLKAWILHKKAHPAILYASEEGVNYLDCTYLSSITSETMHFLST